MPPNIALLSKINDLIQTEDDLKRISTIKSDLEKEKSAIHQQLNIEFNSRVDKLTTVFNNLQNSSKGLKNLKENLNKIEELRENSVLGGNESFEIFNKSSTVYNNFNGVLKTYEDFVELPNKIAFVDQLLDAELPLDDYFVEDSKCENLLIIHFKLNQLRDFKDSLTLMSENSRTDTKQIISKAFAPLTKLVYKFDKLIKLIIDSFINIISCGNFNLIIKLVKIIEFEEREDFKLKIIEHLLNHESNSNLSESNGSKVIKLSKLSSRSKPRLYKERFNEDFIETIDSSMDDILRTHDVNDILNVIEENYYEILDVFKVGIEQGFPTNWKFFENNILIWYQSSLRKILLEILNNDQIELSNLFIVQLLTFDYNNKKILKEKYKLRKAKLEELTLLNRDIKEKLLNDHLEFNRTKTLDWVNNAMKPATTLFELKSQEPPDSVSGKLGIETAQTIIEILKSNLNSLLDIGDSPLLLKYLHFFITSILSNFHNTWKSILNKESKKWNELTTVQSDSTTAEGGIDSQLIESMGWLPRYVTILANDCVKFVNGLEYEFQNLKTMIHISFHEEIDSLFDIGSNYIISTGTECLERLNGFIVVEYNSFIDELFTKRWYKSNEMIINSLDIVASYIEPLKEYLDSELFESLFELVYDSYLLNYLEKLNNREKFDTKKFESIIERDGYLISERFSNYSNVNNSSIIQDHTYIFDILIFLVSYEEDKQFIENWNQFLETFNDLPIQFIRLILECKRFKDSRVKFIVSECEAISNEFRSNRSDLTPTFMIKFKYKNKK